MSVNEIEQKLAKGRRLLNKAHSEPDLLDPALNAIHGALEDACRNWLAAPNIKRLHRIEVHDNSQASWKILLDLVEKYCGWSKQDIRYVARMNSLRNQNAHGGEFTGTHQQVAQYLQFVEQAIAKGGQFTSIDSEGLASQANISTSQHFPDFSRYRRYRRIAVSPFRFNITRNKYGVKFRNNKGAKIIGVPPDASSGNQGCRNLVLLVLGLLVSFIVIIFGLILIVDYESLLTKLQGVALILALPITFFYLGKNKSQVNDSKKSEVFIASDRVYIGKHSYFVPPGTIFGGNIQKTLNPEAPDLHKVYFIQPHGAVYFAHSLTWHEADEVIRIAVNASRVIDLPQASVAIELKDNLIFIKSKRKSFVVDYDRRLWESLYCRLVKQSDRETLVQLTKSEFEELYNRKLQEF